jgi:hypothetical protein
MQTFLEIYSLFTTSAGFSLAAFQTRHPMPKMSNPSGLMVVRVVPSGNGVPSILIPGHGRTSKRHAGKADSQSQHADDGLGAVFPQIADSDFQVMYDHGFIPF